jgi:hypothetical protein
VGAEDPRDPDDLYGLALEEFVAARDALAKRLRAGGERAAADAVKRLPKPSAAAWAVNQAVRSQPRAARQLWTAGDELAATQERLLAGDADRDALRAATTAERQALAPLLDAARGLLTGSGAGVSETAMARVEESLHAAALDPGVRPDVAAGRLAKELRHVGMGTVAGPASGGERRATRAAGGAATKGRGAATKAGGAAAEPARGEGARRRSAEREADDRRAEREADDRRAAREAAKERIEAARRDRAAARDALKSAREESRAAAKRAADAVRAAQDARRDADRATAAADAAVEQEQAARDALDEAEAALRSARG